MTIGLTRAVFEAAVQKYGTVEFCTGIGNSKRVGIERVLGGILVSQEFEPERKALLDAPSQLVLIDFTSKELAELYQAEKLAYEVWRTGAALRIVGKGAHIVVAGRPDYFQDDRSEELAFLIENYDGRDHNSSASSLGVSYSASVMVDGTVFLPTYNLLGVDFGRLNQLTKKLHGFSLQHDLRPNFVWVPFDLRAYRNAHLPMADAFCTNHGVTLDIALATLAALCIWANRRWMSDGIDDFMHLWKRAYIGPYSYSEIIKSIEILWAEASKTIGNCELGKDTDSIEAGVRFWSLGGHQRELIDTVYSGPHQIVLPAGSSHYFVDYAWISRRLFDFFVGTSISDQNFKGKALEKAAGEEKSFLPTGECVGNDNTRKQVDYAIVRGKRILIIVECKAVARSIAFDRGRPQAIEYRKKRVVEEGLRQVDEKARWLVTHVQGRNYDISGCSAILPVVISPFVEFIHSRESQYWITKSIPRVLTWKEFRELLRDASSLSKAQNVLAIPPRLDQ